MHWRGSSSPKRSRWAAIGAAVAVTVGSGGLMSASAAVGSGAESVFVSITPCRIADTRAGSDNVGPRAIPLGATETYSFAVRGTNGNCTIPDDAVAVAVNVAAVFPSDSSFFTLFPSDAETRPVSANLNFVAGAPPVSNSASIRLSADGRMSIFNLAGTVHFTLDVTGYYAGHHHDDLYYTKVEADAQFAPKVGSPITDVQILDGSIGTADVADGAVTSAKILDGTIGTGDVADSAITSAKVQNDLNHGGPVGGGLDGDADIKDNSITTFDIAANAIDSEEVADFSLSNQDIGVLYAVVTADGVLARSSGGIPAPTSAKSPTSAGSYTVDFNRNITNCAFVATLAEPGVGTPEQSGEIALAGMVINPAVPIFDSLVVKTTDSDGLASPRDFHVVVVC